MSAKDFHAVYGLLVLFFPGVVFVFFSTFVQQGRPPAITKDTVGGMVAVAVLYIFIVWSCGLVSTTEVLNPLLMFANEGAFCQLASRLLPASLVDPSCSLASPRRLQVFCIFVLAPAAFGIGWGQVVRKKLHFKLAKRLRLELADTGCAWDVAFEMPPSGGYVIVTLKDGMTVAGYLESRSAISNDPGFRDIFIGDTVGLMGSRQMSRAALGSRPTKFARLSLYLGERIPSLRIGNGAPQMSSSAKNDFSQTPYPRRAYIPVGNAPRVNPGNMGSAVQKPVTQTTQTPSPAPSQTSQGKS